jgi:hypothetical protein
MLKKSPHQMGAINQVLSYYFLPALLSFLSSRFSLRSSLFSFLSFLSPLSPLTGLSTGIVESESVEMAFWLVEGFFIGLSTGICSPVLGVGGGLTVGGFTEGGLVVGPGIVDGPPLGLGSPGATDWAITLVDKNADIKITDKNFISNSFLLKVTSHMVYV